MNLLSGPMLVRGLTPETRSIEVVASSEALDSHGTIIDQSTWDLARYAQNPVVLWAHNAAGPQPPIGYAEDVRVEAGALRARVHFVDESASALAEQIWQGVKQRSIRGLSVGFRSKNTRVEKRADKDVMVLSDCELFEISFVPVPSNAETLAEMRTRAVSRPTSNAAPPQKVAPMTLSDLDRAVARAMRLTEEDVLQFKESEMAERAREIEEASLTPDELTLLRHCRLLSPADIISSRAIR